MDDVFEIEEPDRRALAMERDRLIAAIRAELPFVEVHEVGSTAVEGVIGKGDLDLVVLAPADRFEDARAILDRLYARDPEQHSSAIFQGYVVASTAFDIAVQATVKGGPYDVFDLFIDALRADPERIRAYNDLKRAWHGLDMTGYRRAKAVFIETVLAAEKARLGGSESQPP